jgi:hypothetical protein
MEGMPARGEEINDLLSTVAKLSEVASRNRLTLATHLLDMLQLELTMIMFGYSDNTGDDPAEEVKSGKSAVGTMSVKRRTARARRA